ncbi:MAG: hypothetical protein JWL66_2345 [Sphingomonadales bacterium]|nr:hypothetical protein [Sphingomonadales bacterium]
MREQDNMDYYQKRALRERELANTSNDATVARVHLEMAERYEFMINAAEATLRSPTGRAAGR